MPRTYNDTMFIDTFEHEYTWLNGFLRNAARFAGRPAMIDPLTDRHWNYRELNQEANRFLLSDTQQLLQALISDSDSPFIFE